MDHLDSMHFADRFRSKLKAIVDNQESAFKSAIKPKHPDNGNDDKLENSGQIDSIYVEIVGSGLIIICCLICIVQTCKL